MILTSGTLSPLSTFASEMMVPFAVQLENPHIIQAHQVWAGVVRAGPSGKELNSSFEFRDTEDYKRELGDSLVNFARITPAGMLVFFPSYSVMQSCLNFWQTTTASDKSIWDRISQHKAPFVEPQDKREFAVVFPDYYSKIRDPCAHGAIFFAVCRGKVSEVVSIRYAQCGLKL